MVAPVALVRELLAYRDMNLVSARDWGMITGLFAGASIAFPVLTPFAAGSLVAAAVQKFRQLRAKKAVTGIAMPPPVIGLGATAVSGIARKLRACVSSLRGGDDVLAEHAEIRDREGVILRRSEAAPFWLERDGEPRVMIVGAMRRIGHAAGRVIEVERGDEVLRMMGIPKDFAIAGELEIASIAEATRVVVLGAIEDEIVAEAAFHRDGGQVAVMRGRPGAPLLVSY